MNKKSVKIAEIIRLQERVAQATKTQPHGTNDPLYTDVVDEYLTFLLHFVGTPGYEWTENRLTKMDRICELTTNIRSEEVLMKIPEDMIPPVAVREMLLGDEDGPWMHAIASKKIGEFIAKYPFLIDRMPT